MQAIVVVLMQVYHGTATRRVYKSSCCVKVKLLRDRGKLCAQWGGTSAVLGPDGSRGV
jgi:hypothetical protein